MNLIETALLGIGVAFAFLSALGLWRLKTPLERLHASSKASTLGIGLTLVAVALHVGSDPIKLFKLFLALWFLVLTAPVIGHLLGLTAWKSSQTETKPKS